MTVKTKSDRDLKLVENARRIFKPFLARFSRHSCLKVWNSWRGVTSAKRVQNANDTQNRNERAQKVGYVKVCSKFSSVWPRARQTPFRNHFSWRGVTSAKRVQNANDPQNRNEEGDQTLTDPGTSNPKKRVSESQARKLARAVKMFLFFLILNAPTLKP